MNYTNVDNVGMILIVEWKLASLDVVSELFGMKERSEVAWVRKKWTKRKRSERREKIGKDTINWEFTYCLQLLFLLILV